MGGIYLQSFERSLGLAGVSNLHALDDVFLAKLVDRYHQVHYVKHLWAHWAHRAQVRSLILRDISLGVPHLSRSLAGYWSRWGDVSNQQLSFSLSSHINTLNLSPICAIPHI